MVCIAVLLFARSHTEAGCVQPRLGNSMAIGLYAMYLAMFLHFYLGKHAKPANGNGAHHSGASSGVKNGATKNGASHGRPMLPPRRLRKRTRDCLPPSAAPTLCPTTVPRR